MKPRYRISDQGILLIYNETDRRYCPIECIHFEHYCTTECRHFKIRENSALLTCEEPNTTFELEE